LDLAAQDQIPERQDHDVNLNHDSREGVGQSRTSELAAGISNGRREDCCPATVLDTAWPSTPNDSPAGLHDHLSTASWTTAGVGAAAADASATPNKPAATSISAPSRTWIDNDIRGSSRNADRRP
jgi:hypothetical protein